MDTKTGQKQPQVLLCGGSLSGGVYKNFYPSFISLLNLILFPKNLTRMPP